MAFELILFDFDGTLANSFPYFLSAFDEFTARHGMRHPDPEEIETLRGYESHQIMRYFGIPAWRAPFYAADARARMARDIAQIHLFEGIGRVIRGLAAKGKTLAVVSSNSLENVGSVLGLEIASSIRYYECGVSLFGKAPKIRKLMRKTRMTAAQTLLIGDEIRDVEAARKAGVACAAVAWGYTRADALRSCQPDLVFERVEDMLDIP